MGIPYTQEQFLDKLRERNVMYIPLGKYKNSHTKIKWGCHRNDKHTFDLAPCDIYKDQEHCPYCLRQKVFVGETDLWTERPEVAKWLLNPEDGYKYVSTSSIRVDWVCPECGHIVKNKAIAYISKQGLNCPYCSDNISFSEKLVHNLLAQLDCEFIHDRTMSWSGHKRYDFYIPKLNLIIETHGVQHYTRGFIFEDKRSKTLEEEIENDCNKREMALANGIEHYIELDCRYSDFDYVRASILNSELSTIFDLTEIDWIKCFEATTTSNVMLCAKLWNEGLKDTNAISEQTGIHFSSVISHLKKAAQSNMCDYFPHYRKKKRKAETMNKICDLWNAGEKSIKEISNKTGISYGHTLELLHLCAKQGLCDYAPKIRNV